MRSAGSLPERSGSCWREGTPPIRGVSPDEWLYPRRRPGGESRRDGGRPVRCAQLSRARQEHGAPGDQVSGIDDEGSAMRVVAAAEGRCPVAGYLIAGLSQVEAAILDVASDQEIPHLGRGPLRAGQRRGCPGDRERAVRRDAGRIGSGYADAQSSRQQSGRRDPGQSQPSSQVRCPFRRGRRPPEFSGSGIYVHGNTRDMSRLDLTNCRQ
jgi:hypothetical protein